MHPATPNNLRLFGLDLRTVVQDLRRPWQNMHRWPLLSWLAPAVTVRLLRTDEAESFWRIDDSPRQIPASSARGVKFVAVELPEDRVLRRTLRLPAFSDAEIESAVSLEVRSISPFPPEDLVWGYRARPAAPGLLEIEAALASRKQVDAQLRAVAQRVEGIDSPEVWALSASQPPIVISGFGEGKRAQHVRMWHRVGYSLLLLAFGFLVAIAATPTAQLRMRATEAVSAFTTLQQRAEPLLKQREALVKASDQLGALGELVAERVDPLAVMDLLTQALPDDTSLLNLQVQGTKVTFSGLTSNAAALMQQLGTKPGLRDVKAPSAAMKPLGAAKESFTIEFTLDPKVLAPVSSSGQAPAPLSAGAAAPTASAPVSTAPVGNPSIPPVSGPMGAFTTGGRAAPPAQSAPAAPAAAASKAPSPSNARATP